VWQKQSPLGASGTSSGTEPGGRFGGLFAGEVQLLASFPKTWVDFVSCRCGVDFSPSFSTRVLPVFKQELVMRVSRRRLPRVAKLVAGLRRPLAVIRTHIGLAGKMAEGPHFGAVGDMLFDKTGGFQGSSLENPGLMRVSVRAGNPGNLPCGQFFVHFSCFLTIIVVVGTTLSMCGSYQNQQGETVAANIFLAYLANGVKI